MNLFSYAKGRQNVHGHLIEILQVGLEKAGCPTGGVDGVFGAGTETAVRRWQALNNKDDTGVVDTQMWEQLTGLAPPSAFDLCLQLTAAFEGHGFQKAAGNYDGAAITWGIIGFTLDSGSLCEVLKSVHADRELQAKARSIFTTAKWQQLIDLCNLPSGGSNKPIRHQKMQDFANGISIGTSKARLRADWDTAFSRLGALAGVRDIQMDVARSMYWDRAVGYARDLLAHDMMDMSILFDTTVNNGSVAGERREMMERTRAPSGQPRRVHWANAIADASKKRWRENVRTRRMTIATGEGTVHGGHYMLSQWGIIPEPIEMGANGDIVIPGAQSFAPTVGSSIIDSVSDWLGGVVGGRLGTAAPAVVPSIDFMEEIPVPQGFNAGLRQAGNSKMISYFGMPRGDFSQACREPNNAPFRELCRFGGSLPGLGKIWWGLDAAFDNAADALVALERRNPMLFKELGSAGMGCCRHVRGSSSAISNHSWGSAIDFTIGGSIDPYNNGLIRRGMIDVIEVFNEFGWYSGAYFRREDSMHLELSVNLLEKWAAGGLIPKPSTGGASGHATLQMGDRGDAVRALQRMLNQTGATLVVDGAFGPSTFNVLKAFQMRVGLTADGIYGRKSAAALKATVTEDA
ncbi:MAG: peptidoglycan-binding protein [Pseudomonadota bacterium]